MDIAHGRDEGVVQVMKDMEYEGGYAAHGRDEGVVQVMRDMDIQAG